MANNTTVGTKSNFQTLPGVPDNQKLKAAELNQIVDFQKAPAQQITGSLDDTDIIIDGTKQFSVTIVVAGATRTITANASGHFKGNHLIQRYTFDVDCTLTLVNFDSIGNNTGTITPIPAGTYDFIFYSRKNGINLMIDSNVDAELIFEVGLTRTGNTTKLGDPNITESIFMILDDLSEFSIKATDGGNNFAELDIEFTGMTFRARDASQEALFESIPQSFDISCRKFDNSATAKITIDNDGHIIFKKSDGADSSFKGATYLVDNSSRWGTIDSSNLYIAHVGWIVDQIAADFKAKVIKTLASDVAAIGTDRNIAIAAQTGVTDDLIEITGLSIGQIVLLTADTGDIITVKNNDAGATIKILIQSGSDFILDQVHATAFMKMTSTSLVQVNTRAALGLATSDSPTFAGITINQASDVLQFKIFGFDDQSLANIQIGVNSQGTPTINGFGTDGSSGKKLFIAQGFQIDSDVVAGFGGSIEYSIQRVEADDSFRFQADNRSRDILVFDTNDNVEIFGAFTQTELSADPSDPDEGKNVTWQSDGTGSGDDGDIMMLITAGGVTKLITLVDFSAI